VKTELFEVSGGGTASGTTRQSYQLRGYGTTGDDDANRERINAAAVCSPPGFVSRPIVRAGLRALGLIREDESVTLLGLFDRAISHAVEVATGEARVFSPQTPAVHISVGPVHIEIRLEAAGELRLHPDAADYKGQPVARKTDDVQVTIAPGTVLVSATGGVLNAAPITLSGTITNGALKVKA